MSEAVAVLVSGGIDSCVLVAEMAESQPEVHPLYVRFGLQWETAEEIALRTFLAGLDGPGLRPLRVFDVSLANVYGRHWSTTGIDVPHADSPDEDVLLPGRSLLLLAPTAVWCSQQGIGRLAFGSLAGNPFSDATPEFDRRYEELFELAVGSPLRIERPYRNSDKVEVLRRGARFPLHETFSCISPVGETHCGRCNKCAERRRAFSVAGIEDRTIYHSHD